MQRVFTILLGAMFAVGVSIASGRLFLRRMKLPFSGCEPAIFAFPVGAVAVSTAMFFLCLVHAARLAVILPLGLAAIGFALRRREAQRSAPWDWRAVAALAVIAPLIFIYFFYALAPEVSADGSGYHLGNVARMASAHGFAWGYHSIYSYFPQGMEMLFLAAFEIGEHSAAALVHFAFLVTLPLLVAAYGYRVGHSRAGLFAAILTFGCPVLAMDGVSAYNDVALATCSFAVFFALQVWDEIQTDNLLVLIGLLAGFCATLKYTGALVPLFAVAWVFWRWRNPMPVIAVAALVFLPWAIRDWVWVGNPAAPFFNRWFPNPWYTAVAETSYLADLAHWPIPLGQAPIDITMHGASVPGFLGPVFLLAPLGLLSLWTRQGRRLLLAGAVFGLPMVFNVSTRFLIPAVPFVALAMGIAMENSPGVLPALAIFHVVLALPAVTKLYSADYAWRIREIPVAAALRRVPEAAYLKQRLSDYGFKEAIEGNVPVGDRVFSFAGRPEAYFDREIVVGYESALGLRAQEMVGNRNAQGLKALGIHFLLMNAADPGAEDMKLHPNSWGITHLQEIDGTTFYRID